MSFAKQTYFSEGGIEQCMKHKLLHTLVIILGLFSIVHSQEIAKENEINPVSENVMQKVVRRILVYKFKPLKRKKAVNLAQGILWSQEEIKESWLPRIKNIEFRLLSDEEVKNKEEGVYFFRKAKLTSKKFYEIGFAFGNPDCFHIGNTWRFRILKNKTRLWLPNIGFGSGCAIA